MTKRDERREELVDRIADYGLANGLDAMSLRPVARAIGTSDRMLLYYFEDKDALLAAVLDRLAHRVEMRLAGATMMRLEPEDLLDVVWEHMRTPELRPYLLLWIELVAKAGRQGEPYQLIAQRISDRFADWLAERLLPGGDLTSGQTAFRLLATLEGLALLAIARRDWTA